MNNPKRAVTAIGQGFMASHGRVYHGFGWTLAIIGMIVVTAVSTFVLGCVGAALAALVIAAWNAATGITIKDPVFSEICLSAGSMVGAVVLGYFILKTREAWIGYSEDEGDRYE